VPSEQRPPSLQAWQEERVLRFLNAATADEIERAVRDDPGFGSGSPRAYGVRPRLAARIVSVRDAAFGGQFTRLADVDAIFGMGPDTLHDLLAALLTRPVEIPLEVVRRLRAATRVVAVTGAGVSRASGLEPLTPAQLAKYWTPKAFAKDVEEAWTFHLERRDAARAAVPNEAHTSLAAMAEWMLGKPGGAFTLVTQNQDRLHRSAVRARRRGEAVSEAHLLELHGHLFQGRCTNCGEVFELPDSLGAKDPHNLPAQQEGPRYFVCTHCKGMARPTVQWLTEPYAVGTLDVAGAAVKAAQVVLFIGASGRVPAVRWLLHEAHWNARAYTIVLDEAPALWTERDGTPDWPGTPIIDAIITGDVIDAMVSLQGEVGWPA
jgi:NAD-dependent deacetylase